MYKSILVAALLAAAPASSLPATTVAPQTLKTGDCSNYQVLSDVWNGVLDAYRANDLATTKKATEDMIAVCGAFPTSVPPRVLRATIAESEGDEATVLSALQPVQPAVSNFGARPSWMKLHAMAVMKDEAGFAQERERLLAAIDRSLGDAAGPLKGKRIEAFDVGANHVVAYQTTVVQAPNTSFRRELEFIVHRQEPYAEPISILLTYDSTVAALNASNGFKASAEFLDGYSCAGHFTLQEFAEAPSYAQTKNVVIAALTPDKPFGAGAISSTLAPSGQACIFVDYISPGLAPPPAKAP